MGPLDALMHLGNLFLPGLALGALAAALAKLLWRKELAPVSFKRLALPAALAAAAVTLAGLVVFGRDGRMATYAGMVLACALTLWWRGFGPGRR
ncbi:hypothetical protein [Rubrivivax rivuli]|uniref:Uncharacterized protein n=1 Tax=Rubrivivax rivuli TaxID=1862385 RepID=A0A437R995_9BURK|nr:hypothetical protein [Rubrivivax rivuli]RVU43350.1 hypothetical protein EOE66_20615 [Rubrivivax rivuli]